jgi:hypothetical protein
MKLRHHLVALAAATVALFGATSAQAVDVTYILNYSDPAAGLGSGPYGTVGLTQDGADVDFVVTLNAGFNFVMTGNLNSHALFSFNGTGVSVGDVGGITNGTASTFAAYAPATASPFGHFDLGIKCTSCAQGGAGKTPSPLSFTVANASLGDFALLSTNGNPNAYFSADVITGRFTGQVGATDAPVPGVPEPETYALMLAGLGVVGMLARRRRPE